MDASKTDYKRREKPHFLFWGTKWLRGEPNRGPSNCAYFTWDTLNGWDFATYDVFLVDDHYLTLKRPVDSELIQMCKAVRPDYFVLVWLPSAPDYLNPTFETLYIIRKNLRIPIIAMWPDTWADLIVRLAEKIMPLVDVGITTDPIESFKNIARPDKYMSLPFSSDTTIFFDPKLERDINISFNGRIINKQDRIKGINALRAAGINVHKTGGQLEDRLTLEEYAGIYKRSKISLNFCGSGDKLTYKGRLMESTLCGTMLLESDNPETPRWFEPMVEFVPFKDERDLAEKARYYLTHDSERIAIAENGRRKAFELCRPENFWGKILDKLKLEKSFDDVGSLKLLISSFLESGQKEKANDYMNLLVGSYPNFTDLMKDGVAKLQAGEPQNALISLDKAKEISPWLPNLEFARATALAQLGKLGYAKKACEAELLLYKDNLPAGQLLNRLEMAMKGIPC